MINNSTFNSFQIDSGINIHFCKNPKFKTNLLQFYIRQPLKNILQATKTALLPSVLFRGNQYYSETRELIKKLDELYGSQLNISIIKRGEMQLLRFSLEVINEKFLTKEVSLFPETLKLLQDIVFHPLLENGTFVEKYVSQEKNNLTDEIRGLLNDKYSYAIERCYHEMCKNEPFGIYKLGRIKEINEINNNNLYQFYQRIVAENPLDIIIVGDLQEQELHNKLNEIFTNQHQTSINVQPAIVKEEVDEVKEVIEKSNVKQGKLTLGYRSGITRSHPLYYALIVYNGILGAFPHSKLFRNVREKASMAYYAHSKFESTKGLLLIAAGIDSDNYERAKSMIEEQVVKIARGEISEEELEWTKKGVINQLKCSADSNSSLAGYYLLGYVNGKTESIPAMIEKIKNTKKQEIIEVGQKIKLDTIYFLRNGGRINEQ